MATAYTLLAELPATTEEARALLFQGTDEQSQWRPRGGSGWSIAECVDHLAQANALYADAISGSLERAAAVDTPVELAPGFFACWFIAQMEPPPKRRFPAPANVRPVLGRSREEVWSAFEDTQRKTAALFQRCATLDVNGVRFQNPFSRLMRFSAATGLLVQLAHLRRHLWQARQIIVEPAYRRP